MPADMTLKDSLGIATRKRSTCLKAALQQHLTCSEATVRLHVSRGPSSCWVILVGSWACVRGWRVISGHRSPSEQSLAGAVASHSFFIGSCQIVNDLFLTLLFNFLNYCCYYFIFEEVKTERYSRTTLAREFKSQRVLAAFRTEDTSLGRAPVKETCFCSSRDVAGRTHPQKVFWGCPIIEKSITTRDRALGHIMRPKLQIPFNVYGIMAIPGQSILALLRLSFPAIHKHSSSGCIQKDGFQNKRQHSEPKQPRTYDS